MNNNNNNMQQQQQHHATTLSETGMEDSLQKFLKDKMHNAEYKSKNETRGHQGSISSTFLPDFFARIYR